MRGSTKTTVSASRLSPLASGLLTGKYRNGVPPGSRAQLQGYDWMRDRLTNPAANDIVERLGTIAAEPAAARPNSRSRGYSQIRV